MDFLNEEESIRLNKNQAFINPVSRYKQDFEEFEKIGEGGAGRVFRVQHKFDKNIYAVKKVRLYRRNFEENERIKREVTVISRLHN
jgi:serine/threonine protein kinase